MVLECLARLIFTKLDAPENIRLDNITESDFFKYGVPFTKNVQRKTTTDKFRTMIQKINWPKNSAGDKKKWLQRWGVKAKDIEDSKIVRLNAHCIPITYKKGKSEAAVIKNRKVLRDIINESYDSVSDDILNWIYNPKTTPVEPIFFIPLYGYKPSGDSRPDRGLIPYLYSNFPRIMTRKNTMVVMYSIHTPSNTWKSTLENNSNQLWSGIKEYCGLVIVDKTGEAKIL